MATTPRISALIEALQQEMQAHGDLPVIGYVDDEEFVEIDLERNDDGEEPVMLLVLDGLCGAAEGTDVIIIDECWGPESTASDLPTVAKLADAGGQP